MLKWRWGILSRSVSGTARRCRRELCGCWSGCRSGCGARPCAPTPAFPTLGAPRTAPSPPTQAGAPQAQRAESTDGAFVSPARPCAPANRHPRHLHPWPASLVILTTKTNVLVAKRLFSPERFPSPPITRKHSSADVRSVTCAGIRCHVCLSITQILTDKTPGPYIACPLKGQRRRMLGIDTDLSVADRDAPTRLRGAGRGNSAQLTAPAPLRNNACCSAHLTPRFQPNLVTESNSQGLPEMCSSRARPYCSSWVQSIWRRNPESRSPQRTFRCLNAPSARSAATAKPESCAALSLL